jgi:hypothetical protein
MNEVNETPTEVVEVDENEALVKELKSLDRNQLKEKVSNMPLEDLFKITELLFEEFKTESRKYLDKGRNNAVLNSRKITGKLETAFMVWRKNTIETEKTKSE